MGISLQIGRSRVILYNTNMGSRLQVERKYCYSLGDFHDFDKCPFLFFVNHHLQKKYELADGSPEVALGTLLDESVKYFHKRKLYGCDSGEPLKRVVWDTRNYIIFKEQNSTVKPSFFTSAVPFLDVDLSRRAYEVFRDYYEGVGRNIKPSLGPANFSETIIRGDNFEQVPAGTRQLVFKLWGAPDAFEMGEDGVPEIVDYKSRTNIEKGKTYMDMDLMPKIYTLLSRDFLLKLGYDKARFAVRFWQDPKENDFYEEFDLTRMDGLQFLFKQKIDRILSVSEYGFCGKPYCKACNSPRREEFVEALAKVFGLRVMSGEQFLQENREVNL